MLLMDKPSHGYFVVFTLAKVNNIIEINNVINKKMYTKGTVPFVYTLLFILVTIV